MVAVLHEQASDSALVVSVARRNETALSELHRRHAGAVNGLALKITRDATFAEEITQEVFVRLWQQPERFDAERGSLRASLLTTSHGRSIDVVRSESSRRKREQRDFVSTPETFDASPEGEVMAKANARPSSFHTSVGTAIGRWPRCSTKQRELSRAAYVRTFADSRKG
jgi:RNA polymerase sigma-70 factor (ECF subfamily)